MKNIPHGYKKMTLHTDVYSLEAVVNACYSFIDKYYFYLDIPIPNKVTVYFKLKKGTRGNHSVFVHELRNELLYAVLRLQLAKKNKRLREYIVGSALFSHLMSPGQEQNMPAWKNGELEDPLGIGVTWENKYGKKKSRNRS